MSTAVKEDTCCASCAHDSEQAVPTVSPERRAQLNKRARRLAQGLVFYNVAECLVSVAAGALAGSIALVGFGLDSAVEVLSGLVIIWQFRHANPEAFERKALRLIGLAFFALAAYVSVEAVIALITKHPSAASPVGIAVAVLSVILMPTVSLIQRRTGQELGSGSVVADSKQVLLCAAMSLALLLGLLTNAIWGWWWLDPAVALFIAVLAVREGIEAFRGEACACTSGLAQK